MSITAVHVDEGLTRADLALGERERPVPREETPPMTELTAERTVVGRLVSVFLVSVFVALAVRLPWWTTLVPALLVLAWSVLVEVFWNRLQEPVVRIRYGELPAVMRPGQEILLECEVRARKTATIRHIAVGLETRERHGEDTHTALCGEWAVPLTGAPTGARLLTRHTPVRAWQTLRVPVCPPRRWRGSSLDWFLTLRVELEEGGGARRAYQLT